MAIILSLFILAAVLVHAVAILLIYCWAYRIPVRFYLTYKCRTLRRWVQKGLIP